MEFLQSRIDSFNKTKRTKQSLARSTSGNTKWPHPTSYIATPRTLSEAGFYFDPGPEHPDNTTCFMCGKQLNSWEPDDDPFELHYLKCSERCAWASVRCGPEVEKRGEQQFHFADSSRVPASKAMEKARLDTFTKRNRWPHDAVKGHGANSQQMAKAGFVYTPSHPGDDSVACCYCGIALNGWDEDDNPIEEHAKRVTRSGKQCAFLNASKPSRSAPKTSTRSNNPKPASQTTAASSDDELATSAATAHNPNSNALRSMRKSVNRASIATKASASGSRRSARGTGSRTTPSEVDDTENGSGIEAGKHVSKSKGKRKGTASKGKDVMQVVEEEEEPGAGGQDDEAVEILPPPKPKRGPGRPPKQKKTESIAEVEVEVEPAKVPAKKGHARTRSKTALASDSDAAQPQPSGSKRKTTAKGAPIVESEDEQIQDIPVVKQGKKKAKKGEDSEPPSDAAGPARPKGARTRTVSRSKPKQTVVSESDGDVEILAEAEPPRKAPARATKSKSKADALKGKTVAKRAPEHESLYSDDADDAGYATAEPPTKPRHSKEDGPRTSTGSRPQHSKAVRRGEPESRDDSDVEMIDPAPPAPKDIAKQKNWRSPPQSTSSDVGNRPTAVVRKLSRVSSKSKISRSSGATNRSARTEIVEISSDDDVDALLLGNDRKEIGESAVVVQRSKTAQVEATTLKPPPRISLGPSSSPPKALPKGHSKQQSKTFPAGSIRPSAKKDPGSSKSSKSTKLQVELVDRPRTSGNASGSAKGVTPSNAAAQAHAADGGIAAVINGKHAAATQAIPPPVNHVTTPIPSPPASPPPSTSPEDRPASVMEAEGGFPYTPLLSMEPLAQLTMLTEEESMMTVEQWIRRQIERESRMLQEDAERQIAAVREKAAQMRKVIEAL